MQDFSEFFRYEFNLRDLSLITPEHYGCYARHLEIELENGEKQRSTTAGYISALNTVFEELGVPLFISAVQYRISRTDRYSNKDKSVSDEVYYAVLDWLRDRYRETTDIRYRALWHSVRLQRTGGLRFRESVQVKIAMKNFSGNFIDLLKSDGVKTSKPRNFFVRDISAFVDAREFVLEHRHIFTNGSLIPVDYTYDQYKRFCYYVMDKMNKDIASSGGYHSFRHKFAHEEYRFFWLQAIGTDIRCPAEMRKIGRAWYEYVLGETTMTDRHEVRAVDKRIRLQVSEKLGHHRLDVTNSYLGGTRVRGED